MDFGNINISIIGKHATNMQQNGKQYIARARD
jgi:hypothetical protein